MTEYGIQSVDLSKIRCNSEDKKTSGVDVEKKLNEVYGNKYRISLDHEILKDHGAFYPKALDGELVFELRFAPASNVVIGTDPAQLEYEINNLKLEYEVIHKNELADEAKSNYLNGKRYMYEHINHHKTISIDAGTTSIINESINVPRRSMKGILLLFYQPYTAGTRDSEKTLNADINEIKVDINGIPNMLFSQGMKKEDLWKGTWNIFGKENFSMTETKFYAGERYGVFIDLRSMSDNNLHGSALRLINTKDGVERLERNGYRVDV